MVATRYKWAAETGREFAGTGERILPVGLGTHGHGHAFGGIDRSESLEICENIINSVPNGVKVLIDTAPRYGRGSVESWLGELTSCYKRRMLVATKGGRHIDRERDNEKDFSKGFLRSDLERSLERLRIGKIFLYQLHNPSSEQIRDGQLFELLEGFREEGLIEWYGVSVDTAAEAATVLEAQRRLGLRGLASIQAIYSILTKSQCSTIFEKASEQGIGVVTREVLVRGLLTPRSLDFDHPEASAVTKLVKLFGREQLERRRYQACELLAKLELELPAAAIGFSRANPHVSLTLIGCNRKEYLEQDWLDRGPVSSEDWTLLSALSDLKPKA